MTPQILTPSPPTNFHFESTSSSAYTTAPSSPKIFLPNFFYSAPTSPTSITPYSTDDYKEADTDFAFDFSGQLEQPSISDAEDLFHAGKIKPLQPPPDTHNKEYTWSPRLSLQNSSYVEMTDSNIYKDIKDCISPKHKKSQSLSPLRVSDILADHEKAVTTNQSFLFNFMWYNKWNLKNLLLFRSTSEGSATTSDDLIKKYAMVTKGEQDEKNSSFRSCDGGGSVDGSSRKRRMKRKVSAHEIHYTANRAVAEEMKRRTFLPYKSGLLGCLGFSHHSVHDISRRR